MDNATMMEIYPYGGIMAYLKYNFIDGVSLQNLLLVDKTRYDHKSDDKKITVANNPKSEVEAKGIASAFGIGAISEMEMVKNEIGD